MAVRDWREAHISRDASAHFNNPRRAIIWLVPGPVGALVDRIADHSTGRMRISDVELPPEVNCLRTIQFVHRAFIRPGGLHAPGAHEHPGAEDVLYIIAGRGELAPEICPGHCVYIPPNVRTR